MRHLHLFEGFVERIKKDTIWDFLKKIQIFCSLEFQDVEETIGRDMKTYWKDFYDPSEFQNIDRNLPLLFWRNPERSAELVRRGKLPPKRLIYNYPEKFDPGKSDLAKKAQKMGVTWYPKTVFDKEELDQLNFPVIAKKDDSYQSKGVEKIETRKDLGAKKFDVYQECIPIEDEYRVMVFRGKNEDRPKAFGLWKRSPNNGKSKSLRLDESRKVQKSKFVWSPVPLKEFPHWKGVKPIARAVFDFYPSLNVLGLDIAVDKDGKVWCIEHNETPGLVGNSAIRIYKYIFEDCFGKKIPREVLKSFQDKALTYRDFYDGEEYVSVPKGDKTFIDLDSEIVL